MKLPKSGCNLFFTLSFLVLISCGKVKPTGEITSKDFPVDEFDKIELRGNFKVFFVKNQKNFVNVETYPNIASNLDIDVSGKTLSITENRPTDAADFYTVTVYSHFNPKKISLEKAADLTISGGVDTDAFDLDMKDNTVFIGYLTSRKSNFSLSGKARANVKGSTQSLSLKVSDTANIIAPYWEVGSLKLQSTNGNYTEITVKDTLNADVKNTAKLLYYGDPVRKANIVKTASVTNKPLP